MKHRQGEPEWATKAMADDTRDGQGGTGLRNGAGRNCETIWQVQSALRPDRAFQNEGKKLVSLAY